ncbi:hypothetical protein KSC_085710 [Ktedonobacter sp. SOSP1-52]|uniref:hypothetical protein n=1 Tax=Ktedonobacter sp. SOSP1-52 TaxID=2778366 RepID=UPI001915C1D3|nr:hypothetical protein [Ktedonobacter sp. SOSP1-52]GHO69679.1 hypothetical protein KSC_085710 [Ktedonobacter sp. SOSP1-52]
MEEPHAEADEPHIKIVRPSSRRKFLTAILGSSIILGLGSPALMHLAQNVKVAFNTKGAPPNFDDDFETTGAFKREVYELCDGENIICWLAASFLEKDSLLRSGRVAFSEWDTQTEPLAPLIVAKTGLPLYDLRLPAHKRASQLRERAMSSARRG